MSDERDHCETPAGALPHGCCLGIPAPYTVTISEVTGPCEVANGDYLKAGPVYDLLRRCEAMLDVLYLPPRLLGERRAIVAEIHEYLKTPDLMAALDAARGTDNA